VKILFPKYCGQRYWTMQYKYILNMFIYAGCEVVFYPYKDNFFLNIDGKDFFVDIAEYPTPNDYKIPTLKFHCHKEEGNAIPFSPMSFDNWEEFYNLSKTVKYNAKGFISSRQRIYGNAIERRTKIQALLKNAYGAQTETGIIDKSNYFKEISNCLVPVCVPGQNNNLLDRGQFQYMGLGACTISPNLPEILPYSKTLIAGEHYIRCKEDYSDLFTLIEWCRNNTNKCIEIGENAKQLFLNTSTPNKLIEWIETKL